MFLALTSANSAGGDLMALVPAESLFCVRINDFDQMFTDLDQYPSGRRPHAFLWNGSYAVGRSSG